MKAKVRKENIKGTDWMLLDIHETDTHVSVDFGKSNAGQRSISIHPSGSVMLWLHDVKMRVEVNREGKILINEIG